MIEPEKPSPSIPGSGSKRPKKQQGDDLGRGLKWSFIVHAALISAVLVKSLVFPGNPVPYIPALRVDIVGLPDVLKKDLKAPSPPAEEKKAEPPAPEPEKPKAPEVKNEPKADPDEMVLKPKKAEESKPEKETDKSPPPKERQKKLKSALDRIKALDKISDDDGAPAVVKGNQVSKGTSLSGDAREAAEASYYDLVRDRLQDNWSLPVWLLRQNLSAQVHIWIDGRGRLRNFKIMKSSGNAQFDEAVKKTLNDSQPFPVPPEAVASSMLVDGILVGFPL